MTKDMERLARALDPAAWDAVDCGAGIFTVNERMASLRKVRSLLLELRTIAEEREGDETPDGAPITWGFTLTAVDHILGMSETEAKEKIAAMPKVPGVVWTIEKRAEGCVLHCSIFGRKAW